ncbi:MAG: Cytochrome c oxidase subunit 6 [Vezdaea aestivalis]|nr:MAG: Cytochrome c oxidase subunit 6 [Vezdaea aestivalis]
MTSTFLLRRLAASSARAASPNLTRSRPAVFLSTPLRPTPTVAATCCASKFSTSVPRLSGHSEETFEEFNARFEKEFEGVMDVFELQRNLNNVFAYDLVPTVAVMEAALTAARRVNDFPTAVRIFEGIKGKVENKAQYEAYLVEMKDLRESLGVNLKEDLFPVPSA